jgi:hypothetical protein
MMLMCMGVPVSLLALDCAKLTGLFASIQLSENSLKPS